jgi:hypothetical protein
MLMLTAVLHLLAEQLCLLETYNTHTLYVCMHGDAQAALTTALICVPYSMLARTFAVQLTRTTWWLKRSAQVMIFFKVDSDNVGPARKLCNSSASVTVQRTATTLDCWAYGILLYSIYRIEKQFILAPVLIFFTVFEGTGSTLFYKKVYESLEQ